MNDRAIGTLAAALAAVLFGSAYVATAFQLHGFTPLGGALWRSAFAAVGLVVLAARTASARAPAAPHLDTRPSPGLPGRLARLAVIGLFGGLVFIVGMNLAVARLGATVTAFVAGLYAILAALFAPALLSERLEPRALAGFVVALAGTALLSELAPSQDTAGGLVAGSVAAVGFGLYLVLIRRWSEAIRVGPVAIALANAGVASAGLAIGLAILDPGAAMPFATPPDAVLATGWLIVVTAAGQLLVAGALRRIEAGLASSLLLLNPITATALAALLLGERPAPLELAGGVLVLLGMAVAADLPGTIRRRRATRPLGAAGVPIERSPRRSAGP